MLFFYSILTVPWLDKGVSSLDAHGVIQSANNLLNDGIYTPSRPPGHPSYEFYLLYPLGSFIGAIRGFSPEITTLVYNFVQYISGIGVLICFYSICIVLGLTRINSTLASLILCCSPIFLLNSFDGDEVNQALLCFLISFLSLLRALNTSKKTALRKYVICASLFLAIATGFRQEFIFAYLICPIFFLFHSQTKIWEYLKYVPIQFVFGVLVWLPVLLYNEFGLPMPMPMPENDPLNNFKNKIVVGSYKLLFQAYTLPIAILFFVLTILLIKKTKQFKNISNKECYLLYSFIIILPLYVFLFYTYPYKVAFVIITVPVLILGCFCLIKNKILNNILVIFSIFSLCLNVDATRERKIVFLYLNSSLYSQAVQNKSFSKADRSMQILDRNFAENSILIMDLWSWDLQYMTKHKMLSKSKINQLYSPNTNNNVYFANRQILDDSKQLKQLQMRGYSFYISRKLFISRYYKYTPNQVTSSRMQESGILFNIL